MTSAIRLFDALFLFAWKNCYKAALKNKNKPFERNELFSGWGRSDLIMLFFFGFLTFSLFVFIANWNSWNPQRPFDLNNLTLWPSLCGFFFGTFFLLTTCFLIYAADTILNAAAGLSLIALCLLAYYHPTKPLPPILDNIVINIWIIFTFFCTVVPVFGMFVWEWLKTLYLDKDRQAHTLFVASSALLGWGLWLQNGGNWQGMAVMNAPIVVPLVHWEIPFTESVALPFALFGFVHDPVGSAVSTVAHAPLNATLALFSGAAVLFFFAVNRLQYSVVGVRPEWAWLAFALGCAAVYLDVALHWAGAPALPFVLILFNRAVAVLALGVYLFWRTDAKRGLPVPGVTNEYKTAFDMADQSAWKIAAWLLGLLWAATQFSHGFGGEFPEWVKTVLIGLLVAFPVRDAVKFNSEFRNALGRYNQLAALYQQSYKPPSTVATDAQIRDALNGGRGIGGQGIDGKGWHDTGD